MALNCLSRQRKGKRDRAERTLFNTKRKDDDLHKSCFVLFCVSARARVFFAFFLVYLKCPEAKELHRQEKNIHD